MIPDLTERERDALDLLNSKGGVIAGWNIAAKTSCDGYDRIAPGWDMWRRLEKKGLVLITQADPGPNGFEWSPDVEITQTGRRALVTNF